MYFFWDKHIKSSKFFYLRMKVNTKLYLINALNVCVDCNICCKEPFGSPFIFEEEIETIRKFAQEKGLEDHLIKVDKHYELPKINGNCAYLNDQGLCNIYDVRPIDCRVFPLGFNSEGKPGVSLQCPERHNVSEEFKKVAEETLIKKFSQFKTEYIQSATKGGFTFK